MAFKNQCYVREVNDVTAVRRAPSTSRKQKMSSMPDSSWNYWQDHCELVARVNGSPATSSEGVAPLGFCLKSTNLGLLAPAAWYGNIERA
jgi:hypothetical protein